MSKRMLIKTFQWKTDAVLTLQIIETPISKICNIDFKEEKIRETVRAGGESQRDSTDH